MLSHLAVPQIVPLYLSHSRIPSARRQWLASRFLDALQNVLPVSRARRDEFTSFSFAKRLGRRNLGHLAWLVLLVLEYNRPRQHAVARGERRHDAEWQLSQFLSSSSSSPEQAKPHLSLITRATLTELTLPPHLTRYNPHQHLLDPASIQNSLRLAREIVSHRAGDLLRTLRSSKTGLSFIGL